ncbi:MAG: thrombospondin type 3 repeat-containing protein [Pseudomonadota bacterium]
MMKTTLIAAFAALVAATQSYATTSLQISEVGAGVLATEVGSELTEFVVAADYPTSTVGNTQLVLTLTDDSDSSVTVLQFPVYVSAYINNSAQNTPAFAYLKAGAPTAATVTGGGSLAAAADEEADFLVADLGSGSHLITLRATDEIARTSDLTLPLYTQFEDSDGDGIANVIDTDDDGDGVPDVDDYFPLDALVSLDTDQDGIGDEIDDDDDNDGILDVDDPDPKNVDHLVLGPPMPPNNLIVLQAASIAFVDDDVVVDQAALELGAAGAGLSFADRVRQDVSVDTSRDYDAVQLAFSDSRVATQTVRVPFNAYAYRTPEALPAAVSISSDTVLTEVDDTLVETSPNGLFAVYKATFASADPVPYVRLAASLAGASPVSISTIGDRSVDDDGIPAFLDDDWDGDGVLNIDDAFPEDAAETTDTDGDGIGDVADTDDDNDLVPDVDDAFPLDGTESVDTDSDGIGNNADDDDDGDGVLDVDDAFPLDPTRSSPDVAAIQGVWYFNETPGAGAAGGPVFFIFLPDGQFMMAQDGDSVQDPNGMDGLEIGTYEYDGTTLTWPTIVLDTNGEWGLSHSGSSLPVSIDGDTLTVDGGPVLTRVTSTSLVGGWMLEGTIGSELISVVFLDNNTFMVLHGDDPNDDCACGQAGIEFGDYTWNEQTGAFGFTLTTDTNGEWGISNSTIDMLLVSNDTLTLVGEEIASATRAAVDADTDGDGQVNSIDADDDGDGVGDSEDAFPLYAGESLDTDGDGIGNNADADDDGDGVPDLDDRFPLDAGESVDTDNDGIGNNTDVDDDGDGIADIADAFPLDPAESTDTDGDGIGNNADSDDDNDGVADVDDAFPLDPTETLNTDGDAFGNNADDDDDNDGVPDVDDAFPLDPTRSQPEGPASRLKNLATRGFIGTGDNVLIGGLIITGTEPKTVVIRARGPALADAGVTGALLDPEMALFSGATVIDSNDNWETHPGVDLIPEDLKPTAYPNEAVIATTLAPGAYTAIVGGKDGTTGIGLVEIFEVTNTGVTRLQNIATRGFVDTGDGVLIGGLVISGSEPKKVVIRAKGPSLTEQGVPGALANPRIAIFSGASVIKTNDSWDSEDNLDREKIPLDLRPTNSLEATVYMELAPGPYTAIVDGSDGGTGVGIVEVFEVLD